MAQVFWDTIEVITEVLKAEDDEIVFKALNKKKNLVTHAIL